MTVQNASQEHSHSTGLCWRTGKSVLFVSSNTINRKDKTYTGSIREIDLADNSYSMTGSLTPVRHACYHGDVLVLIKGTSALAKLAGCRVMTNNLYCFF